MKGKTLRTERTKEKESSSETIKQIIKQKESNQLNKAAYIIEGIPYVQLSKEGIDNIIDPTVYRSVVGITACYMCSMQNQTHETIFICHGKNTVIYMYQLRANVSN
jgi:hypothetical protein